LIHERRRLPRYRLDAEISVNDRLGRAVDISSSGVFFESPVSFTPGEEVVLIFPFQESGPDTRVECRAQVLRVEPRGTRFGVAATYEPTAFTVPG
jgi:hypothetical protein